MSEEQSAEFKTPIFSASMKGKDIQVRDVILIAVLMIVSITAYAFYDKKISDEKRDSQNTVSQKERDVLLTAALKDLAKATRESSRDQVKEQRMLRCVIATDQKDRRRAEDDCERLFR